MTTPTELKDHSALEDALVFAILMQHGRGLLYKSPDYVLEKWEAIKSHPGENRHLLDGDNKYVLQEWLLEWGSGL